ncbi:MAG: TonB-dependent receptor [Saprospiraceae bacterium]
MQYLRLSAFLLFLALSCGHLDLQAQEIEVSGIVYSHSEKEPLIGVNIVEKNTGTGTTTDIDGKFSITITPNTTLIFSYIGFKNQEITPTTEQNLEVYLEADSEMLEDVIVLGYRKETKSNVSSAIASLKSEDIDNLAVLGLDQALQGQVAGLQVTQATGAPGDDVAIRIRGVGTIGNNNPLFIVDGVPTTGNINMFSVADIASIEVLKDGASASIYGARAANGVIVITTKKGVKGKSQINLDTYYGIQESNRLPELLNAEEYLGIRNEAINNANQLRDPIRQLTPYDPAILNNLPDINWLDEVFQTAPMYQVNLNASGGGENGNFYVMGEYFNQEGVFKGQGFEKLQLRLNGEVRKNWLTIGNNVSIAYSDRKVIGSSGDGAGPGNELSGIRYALIAAPVFPIRDEQGEFVPTSAVLGDPFLYGDGNANPLAFIENTDWNIQRYRVFGNVFAQAQINPMLSFKTNLGIDLLFRREKIFKERLSAAIYDPTSLSEGTVTDRNLVWNNTLDFNHALGAGSQHRINGLLGMEAIVNQSDFLGVSVNNFISAAPNFRYIDASIPQELANIGASGITTRWGLLSYFAQVGYSYKNKYVFNASVRRDGSSRFGERNRFGTFPAVSAAWNLGRETFMSNTGFISDLKLRASWGQLGNQEIGIYPFSSLVETGIRVYPFGGQIATGARVLETGNENIRWETTTQTDFGIEVGLFDDQWSLSADYYIKNSNDILVRVPLPQTAGDFNPPFINAGEIQNTGLELALTYRYSSKDLSFDISGNISTVNNEVTSLAASEPILGGFGLSDGPITKTEPGYPVGSFFLYDMIGIFQTQAEIDESPFQSEDTRPGDVKFADINGDNVIDDKDRAHLGNPFPDFIYGFNARVAYKNFDLSTVIQGVYGNDVYFLYGNFAYETQSRGFNSYREILNRWTPENPSNTIPKVSFDDRNGNRRISTRFLEDGSYLRVRNITLGYELGKALDVPGINRLRLYFTVQNAFTFTKYSGLDPEIQANTNDTQGFNVSSDLAVGIDWGTVPAPRTFLFGINAGF